jgi:hypothetical protein
VVIHDKVDEGPEEVTVAEAEGVPLDALRAARAARYEREPCAKQEQARGFGNGVRLAAAAAAATPQLAGKPGYQGADFFPGGVSREDVGSCIVTIGVGSQNAQNVSKWTRCGRRKSQRRHSVRIAVGVLENIGELTEGAHILIPRS